jgi:hypothetical protein
LRFLRGSSELTLKRYVVEAIPIFFPICRISFTDLGQNRRSTPFGYRGDMRFRYMCKFNQALF